MSNVTDFNQDLNDATDAANRVITELSNLDDHLTARDARIEELEEERDELKSQIEKLEERVSELESDL